MPCRQVSAYNGVSGAGKSGGGGFATEAECLNACKEGACCEGTTCSVKPQCQCQGTGKTFNGVGTMCTPNPCGCKCGCSANGATPPDHIYATVSGGTMWDGTYVLDRLSGGPDAAAQDCFQQAGLNYAAFSNGFWGDSIVGSKCCCSYATILARASECIGFAPPVGDTPWYVDQTVGGFIFASPLGSWVTLPYSRRTQGGQSCCFSIYGNTLSGGSLPGLSSGSGYCSTSWSASTGSSQWGVKEMKTFNNIPCPSSQGGFGYDGPYPVITFHA